MICGITRPMISVCMGHNGTKQTCFGGRKLARNKKQMTIVVPKPFILGSGRALFWDYVYVKVTYLSNFHFVCFRAN